MRNKWKWGGKKREEQRKAKRRRVLFGWGGVDHIILWQKHKLRSLYTSCDRNQLNLEGVT